MEDECIISPRINIALYSNKRVVAYRRAKHANYGTLVVMVCVYMRVYMHVCICGCMDVYVCVCVCEI